MPADKFTDRVQPVFGICIVAIYGREFDGYTDGNPSRVGYSFVNGDVETWSRQVFDSRTGDVALDRRGKRLGSSHLREPATCRPYRLIGRFVDACPLDANNYRTRVE